MLPSSPERQTDRSAVAARAMIKRLEQVAALVVAAGLAIVSYWLFFSWAQGGGGARRQRSALEAPAGLQQPLLAVQVLEGADVGLHLLNADRQVPVVADPADLLERA